MVKIKLGFIFFSFLLITACSGSNQQEATNDSVGVEAKVVVESDSLSKELSTATDSVEKKMENLQTALDKLNN